MYSREGSLTNETNYFYFDAPCKCQQKYEELNRIYWTDETEDGEIIKTNIKMYKVEVFVSAYKKIEDANSFFSQFEV